jgi:hypothetical protein
VESEALMITQIILRYEDLSEDDRTQMLHNILLDNVYADKQCKVYYKLGGINKPMIEVKKADVGVN